MTYDEAAVVRAYIDSLREPYPHKDFQVFRKARLSAIEDAYDIRIAHHGVAKEKSAIAMLFFSTARGFLSLDGTRAGMLDDSLINLRLEELDTDGCLRDLEADVNARLHATKDAYMTFLVALFRFLWVSITSPIDSDALRARGFDDDKEPRLLDYVELM